MIPQLRRPRWTLAFAIAIASLLPTLLPVRAQAAPKTAPPAQDAFETADREFMAMYGAGRAALQARLGPTLLVEGDGLVLIRNGERVAVNLVPPLYHRLKSVTHIPLALYVALAPHGDHVVDEARQKQLRTFRTMIASVVESLDQAGFTPEQATRSRTLLQRCTTFVDHVLEQGSYEAPDLLALTRFAGPLVLACANDAARLQIDAYHAQVKTWRHDMPADEWAKLRVIVFGPQMPRRHSVAVQYFAKLLKLPGESRRLVYAEELTGEQQGLNLLATHQLDSEIGEAFFGDPERMEFDLIGNAASVYLDLLDFAK